MEICRQVYGEDSLLSSRLYINIGIVYEDNNDYVKAYEFFRKWATVSEIVLGPDHDLYVSSQDTGLVSRFAEPTAHSPGAPRPTIIDGFPSGTFISPQNGAFQTGKYPIRGITFDAVGALYVANEKRNEIEVYDHAGAVLPSIISTEDVKVDRPVQVPFDAEGTLSTSSAGNNAVLSYADNTLAALIGPHGAHLDAVSGIDVDANGHLYVGSRKAKYVLRYALPGWDGWDGAQALGVCGSFAGFCAVLRGRFSRVGSGGERRVVGTCARAGRLGRRHDLGFCRGEWG